MRTCSWVALVLVFAGSRPGFGEGAGGERPTIFEAETGYVWDSDLENDSGSLSLTEYDVNGQFGGPIGEDVLVRIRPAYGVTTIDSDTDLDLPESLQRVSLPVLLLYEWSDHWAVLGEVSPSFQNDFEEGTSDAWHAGGTVGFSYEWDETLTLYFGAAYRDCRDDLFFPWIGVDWRPSEEWHVALMPPRPRIVYSPVDDLEFWISSEANRTEYAVEIESLDEDDLLEIRDYRATLGVQWWFADHASVSIEGGGVFGRELEYDDLDVERDIDSAAMARIAFRIRL